MSRDVGIRKDGGRWCAVIKVNGQQHQKACDTKKEARALRRRWEQQVADGTFVPPRKRKRLQRLTVRSWSKKWIKGREERRSPVRAIRDEKSRLKHHILPVIGDVVLEELHVDDLRRLLANLRTKTSKATKRPLAEKTQFNIGEVVRKMLSDAERHFGEAGVPWRSPWELLSDDEKPEDASEPREAWTRGDAEALISSPAIGLDRRVLYAIPMFTGMRFSEVAGLRWGDIDTRAPELPRIRLTKQVGGKVLKESKKGRRKVRLVPVHPELTKLLERWRREGWRELYNRAPTAKDLIVPSSIDPRRPRNQGTTWRQMKIDAERVGAEPLTYHCTRNTFLTLCCEDSPELEHIIKTITHSASGAAADRYIAGRWRAQCRAMLAFDLRIDRQADVVSLPMTAALGARLGSGGGISEAPADQGGERCRGRDSNPDDGKSVSVLSGTYAKAGPDDGPRITEGSAPKGAVAGLPSRLRCPECSEPAGSGPTCECCGIAFLRPLDPALGAEEEDHG